MNNDRGGWGTSASLHAVMLWLLTLLFALRVLGQVVQRWAPQPGLPDFSAFQGSNIPYWLLLSAQVVILGLMIYVCVRVQAGNLTPNPRLGKTLGWLGAVYFTGSLARIVVGLAVASAAPWFRTWIPAFFHLVLATYVLITAHYHLKAR